MNFLTLDDTVKSDLVSFCKEQELKTRRNLNMYNGFSFKKMLSIADQFEKLAYMYNNFTVPVASLTERKYGYSNTKLKNGFAVYPDDWIVLNEEEAENCSYAYVIEMANREGKYNFPHFIFFSDMENVRKLDNGKIYSMAIKAYPDFIKVLSMQVDAKFSDPDDKGITYLINGDLFKQAPNIGIFKIETFGKKDISNYPFGAMIIRNEDLDQNKEE